MTGTRTRQRRNTRVGCVIEVEYRSAGHLLLSYCANLSRGGLFVCTSDPPEVGERVTLSLRIPDRVEPIRVDSTVRWVRHDDSSEGPRGMGLGFDDIDELLGDQIDRLVASFTPLRIEILGDPTQAWRHVAALAKALVHCEARHRVLDRGEARAIRDADLVIVDVDADPREALALLEALRGETPGPPVLALCSARAVEIREHASRLAYVVPTPVDSSELQNAVLQGLSHVRLVRRAD